MRESTDDKDRRTEADAAPRRRTEAALEDLFVTHRRIVARLTRQGERSGWINARRSGLVALILALVIITDQIARFLPDHPPLARPVWPLVLTYGVCVLIAGFWGGVLAMVTVFGMIAWRFRDMGVDGWLWWAGTLVAFSTFLLTFIRFGPRPRLPAALRRSLGRVRALAQFALGDDRTGERRF